MKKNGIKIASVLLAGMLAFGAAPQIADSMSVVSYAASKLAAPKNFKAASKTANSVKLTWTKVSGANAYRIYKYDSKTKSYKTYKSVTTNSCNVTGLSAGTTYKFRVAALVKSGSSYKVQTLSSAISVKTSSSSSSSSSAKLAAPKNIKCTPYITKVTLKWDAVSGASGYRVYVRNNATGKYEAFQSVSETQCDVTGLSPETTYKFKVVSLIYKNTEYVEQKASSAVSATTKAKTTDDDDYPTVSVSDPAPAAEINNVPKEFYIPESGSTMDEVFRICGIANYEQKSEDNFDDNRNGTITYRGAVLFNYISSELKLVFNRDKTIRSAEVKTYLTEEKYEEIAKKLEKKVGVKPNAKSNSLSENKYYIWTTTKTRVKYEYNIKEKYSTLIIEYTGW